MYSSTSRKTDELNDKKIIVQERFNSWQILEFTFVYSHESKYTSVTNTKNYSR